MYSLIQIRAAVESLNAETVHIDRATHALEEALDSLNQVAVKGRQDVDTMLGCMMAIEQIIGKEDENG